MTPSQFAEAKRLHDAGLKLCELHPMSKRPLGDGWNNKVTAEEARTDAILLQAEIPQKNNPKV